MIKLAKLVALHSYGLDLDKLSSKVSKTGRSRANSVVAENLSGLSKNVVAVQTIAESSPIESDRLVDNPRSRSHFVSLKQIEHLSWTSETIQYVFHNIFCILGDINHPKVRNGDAHIL